MITFATDNTITFNLKFTPPLFLANLAIRIALLYRKLRFGYTYRRILLTKGKYAIVDPEDFTELTKYKWYCTEGTSTIYARRGGKNNQLSMHRSIIDVPDNLIVDHINHNGLDNRKANLRPATKTQNIRNRRKIQKEKYASKYKGVSFDKSRKKFFAYIKADDKTFYLGAFDDQIDAAKAYDNAARKYHGEFACLNLPTTSERNILTKFFCLLTSYF